MGDLIQANRISDASRIKTGQMLVIPSSATDRVAARDSTGSPRTAVALRQPQEDFVWPVHGKVISIFGMRRGGAVNKGIDVQTRNGADVVAARGGQVSFVHEGLPGLGKTLILDHGNGFATVYAYIGEILVQKGDQVAQRQVIARVGRTGRSEVPALHFEIRRNQKSQNPFYYLP